ASAIEEHIAVGANGFNRDAVVREDFIEISCSAAVKSIDSKFLFGSGENVKLYDLFEALEIIFAKIGGFGGLGVYFQRRYATFGEKFCSADFDVFGDFGERGAGIGGRKLQAMVLRRVVTGGEINGAIEFAALNFV